ncbi:hypothetical protein PUN28_019060 [Cardiocondyla obscurior]|uniref:Uncharacterized protein n=1 Tax=Cardiocondyla obscurior TaxID=286306 RepID=A0AAW2EIM4_9HYME
MAQLETLFPPTPEYDGVGWKPLQKRRGQNGNHYDVGGVAALAGTALFSCREATLPNLLRLLQHFRRLDAEKPRD